MSDSKVETVTISATKAERRASPISFTSANSDDVFEGNRDPALVEGAESVKPRYLNSEFVADHRHCRHERIIPFVPMDSLSPSSDYTG